MSSILQWCSKSRLWSMPLWTSAAALPLLYDLCSQGSLVHQVIHARAQQECSAIGRPFSSRLQRARL